VTHGVGDLVAQRVFAIACGHPDGNDADRLADDPIHKLIEPAPQPLTVDPTPPEREHSSPHCGPMKHRLESPRELNGAHRQRVKTCWSPIVGNQDEHEAEGTRTSGLAFKTEFDTP
jgi:hypothetical protein